MSRHAGGSSSVPDLSIIVVAYNGVDLLRQTLESVLRQTQALQYEIVVVDSASPDRSVERLVDDFPTVRFLFLDENDGYAAANNVGLRASTGRYVALLNPDTRLHDNLFATMVSWLEEHPEVGAAGPALLQPDGSPQPYSYGAAPSPWYLLRRVWSHVSGTYLHTWHGDRTEDVDWVAGTCLVARRRALERIGGLDERFFLYFEDVDLGMRLRQAGWRVVFVPSASLVHYGGASVGAQAQPWYDRSLTRLYAKHYGGVAAATVWWLLQLYRMIQRWTCTTSPR